MSKTLSFYFPLKVSELDALMESFKKEFDELIKDSFSDAELELVEKKLDALAAVYVSPVLSELTFEDFEADESLRAFFESCKSMVLLENVPYLESNPFQVSWLQMFLGKFSSYLVDRGDLTLGTKQTFLEELGKYKNFDGLIVTEKKAPPLQHGTKAPILPIDFLILDVYRELDRLKSQEKMSAALEVVASMDRPRRLFTIMKEGRLDADTLLRLSGLNPKDFDDNLEKLKFTLRKV
jgi:predicted CopG family antitoxin